MTRIDFYILKNHDNHRRNAVVCRLAEKAWQNDNQVYIHTQNAEQLKQLDDLLWTFRNDSFVPHTCVEPDGPTFTKKHKQVLLGHQFEPDPFFDVLINLDKTVPTFFSRFRRVLEVVNQDDNVREQGRQRYSFYRERGYPLHHHNLQT